MAPCDSSAFTLRHTGAAESPTASATCCAEARPCFCRCRRIFMSVLSIFTPLTKYLFRNIGILRHKKAIKRHRQASIMGETVTIPEQFMPDAPTNTRYRLADNLSATSGRIFLTDPQALAP